MRRNIYVWLLLILIILTPKPANAQTRLFKPGDSGVTATLDLVYWKTPYSYKKRAVISATYTHKSLWDIGIGYGSTEYYTEGNGRIIFGNFVLINPKEIGGVGLELGGRYINMVSETQLPSVVGFFIPDYRQIRYRTIQPGLRGFYRNSESNVIFGLSGFYRFRKYEILDTADDVLIGEDYGEVGFALDSQNRLGSWLHLSIAAEYSQNNRRSDQWDFSITFSLGFLFGYNAGDEDDDHEQ